MIDIVISRPVEEIMSIVQTLRTQGMIQGLDFTFAYNPPKLDNDGWTTTPSFTVFSFYQEKYASFFSLRWA